MKQINIFGEEVEPVESAGGRRYKRMQEIHGIKKGAFCKTCAHLIQSEHHGRTYYKCGLWIISHSAATDIRLKNPACGKYEAAK